MWRSGFGASCQSEGGGPSVWKKQFAATYTQVTAPSDSCAYDWGGVINNGATSLASCPTGTLLTGGGYTLTAWNPVDLYRSNAPDNSFPYANGWAVIAGVKTAMSCFKAFAICVR